MWTCWEVCRCLDKPSSLLQSQIVAEAADDVLAQLKRGIMFLQAPSLLSAQNWCVWWKHANLPGWLHWPQAIDYTPSRLECYENRGSDQILHLAFLLNQPHLSPPLLSVVWKLGSNCCCSFSKTNWACLHSKSGQWDSFRVFFLLFQLVCSKCFLHKQLFTKEGGCCYVTLRLIMPLFSCSFYGCHNSCWGVEHPGAPPYTAQGLQFDTPSFNYFLPPFFSLAGQLRPKSWRRWE